jgi:urea transporter
MVNRVFKPENMLHGSILRRKAVYGGGMGSLLLNQGGVGGGSSYSSPEEYSQITGRSMVGMGLGSLFEMNSVFFLMLFIMSALCLILSIGLHGFLSKYHLPFMGLPFLFSMWLIILAAKFFTYLLPLHMGSYPHLADYLFKVSQVNVVEVPKLAVIFCRSLGAVFFQSNFLVGAFIAVGLFLYSRISFTLACLGFLTAFSIYRIVGIDTSDLINLFVGSNFIFFAIAIGGFFIVPNIWSYLMDSA